MNNKHTGWIAVDLDGTLAHYDTFKSITHIGEPVPAMVERVKAWIADGKEVKIFTARVSCEPDQLHEVISTIQDWCTTHIGVQLPITNIKDHAMDELWDDRAVQVEKNTGRPIGYSTRV